MAKKVSSLTAAARMLGSKGGKKGGPALARKATKAQRKKWSAKGGAASKGVSKSGK